MSEQHIDIEIRRLEALIAAETELRRARREDDLRALEKFEQTVQDRFIQVNEFRGALDDLGKTMATRRELETLKDRQNGIVAFQARLAGGFLLGGVVIPLITAIIVYLLTRHGIPTHVLDQTTTRTVTVTVP